MELFIFGIFTIVGLLTMLLLVLDLVFCFL